MRMERMRVWNSRLLLLLLLHDLQAEHSVQGSRERWGGGMGGAAMRRLTTMWTNRGVSRDGGVIGREHGYRW